VSGGFLFRRPLTLLHLFSFVAVVNLPEGFIMRLSITSWVWCTIKKIVFPSHWGFLLPIWYSCEWFFLNWYSGGVESNWVHSTVRPLLGLLCQPQVIMMEKLVAWLAGETEVLGETCPSAALSTTNPTCCLDANPGRCGGKPATNRLSYRTALLRMILQNLM
jgi:hypothetical protein